MHDRENIIAVYMMSNRFDGVLYTGVTAHLVARVQQHKDGKASRFTSKFCATSLVWWEPHALIVDAIRREKRIKKWHRQWKINMIEADNPNWEDRWDDLWSVPVNSDLKLEPWRTR